MDNNFIKNESQVVCSNCSSKQPSNREFCSNCAQWLKKPAKRELDSKCEWTTPVNKTTDNKEIVYTPQPIISITPPSQKDSSTTPTTPAQSYTNESTLSVNIDNSTSSQQQPEPQQSNILSNNKKVIAAVLAVAILIGAFAIYWFNFRGTELTYENVTDYVTVSLSGDLNKSYTDVIPYYDSVDFYGNVKGVDGYEFEDVYITIKVYVGSKSEEDAVSFGVHLNKDGDAIIDETIYFGKDKACIFGIQSYDISSVSGKVVKN